MLCSAPHTIDDFGGVCLRVGLDREARVREGRFELTPRTFAWVAGALVGLWLIYQLWKILLIVMVALVLVVQFAYSNILGRIDDGVLDARRWQITELALFGSILRSEFGPDNDVDFHVTYAPDKRWASWGYAGGR